MVIQLDLEKRGVDGSFKMNFSFNKTKIQVKILRSDIHAFIYFKPYDGDEIDFKLKIGAHIKDGQHEEHVI
ncbi:unnamed protein product [Adineta steineri]|uniref:Uncharacterized protein n=1 Tax=Adineta steineri TaxID=433720 RepID=A0A819WH40_9BILA|nr:unnamed protein product [Adineta steineri]